MKISIVTACLNGERFIRRAVESVLSQEGPFELEYIVRDGLSTDKTLSILAEYGERLKVVSKKDGSPQEAINAGMASASGDIGGWLNADDVYEPGALARVAEAFETDPACRWLYGRCRVIDAEDREMRKGVTFYKNLLGFFPSRNVLLCENYINQPATFWRLDFWREIGGLSGLSHKAAWDYELWLKMSDKAMPKHLRARLASFRRHPGSISESFTERQFQEELAIAKERGNGLHYAIHAFNAWKIVAAYKLLTRLGR
jgi:GT2 family glycosyltransferase